MKVGIITHFYLSQNYGGNLQAYALCEVVKTLGYSAEQISYDRTAQKKLTLKRILTTAYHVGKKTTRKVLHPIVSHNLNIRRNAMLSFNQTVIPHSAKVFTDGSLSDAIIQYDVFITGSDQVWHPIAYCPAYRLDFVPSSKIKLSYAASIAKDQLTDEQLAVFKKSLADFTAVSVREQNAVDLLCSVSPELVERVLDPTMLFTSNDWDELCSERIIEQPYMFCYYLGDDIAERKLATQYARQHHLKLVTLPHLLGYFRTCDKQFGDEQLYAISPEDFISLIKYADIVCTDSFHATVFSGIYKKEYVVFNRVGASSMSSRIYSLTSLYETRERFCDTADKQTIEYIESLSPIDYTRKLKTFEQMKDSSIAFLRDNLKKAEDKLN